MLTGIELFNCMLQYELDCESKVPMTSTTLYEYYQKLEITMKSSLSFSSYMRTLCDDDFFLCSVFSDVAERLEVSDGIFVDKCSTDDGQCISYEPDDFYCPASPTTVPIKSRSNSSGKDYICLCSVRDNTWISHCHDQGLQVRSRPRRQRTTSINQTTTITPSESIIRANNRTIYTAGRPPWYNCAGQQVEPFVIGRKKSSIAVTIFLVAFASYRYMRWQR